MKRISTLIILLMAILHGLSAQQTITKSIIHDGIEREYILYIPEIYNGNDEVPLIFNFHGFGGSAQGHMENGDFRPISDTAGFIIAHPQGTLFNGVPHWNVGGWTIGSTVNDIGFIDALIDSINADYNIDLSRVYSTGMSNGGFFSFSLACQLSERIASIASVTGSMTPETFAFCQPLHPTAILQFHGTSDFVVPYDGADFSKPITEVIDYWVGINNCNTIPIITNLPDINPTDGSTVTHYEYTNGDNDVVTEHFKIIGGGHSWPGSAGGGFGTNYDIDASVEIWKFFLRYSLDISTDLYSNYIESRTSFVLYPNPASQSITININQSTDTDFRIISLVGKVVTKGRLQGESTIVDISALNAGIYFVQVEETSVKLVVR